MVYIICARLEYFVLFAFCEGAVRQFLLFDSTEFKLKTGLNVQMPSFDKNSN